MRSHPRGLTRRESACAAALALFGLLHGPAAPAAAPKPPKPAPPAAAVAAPPVAAGPAVWLVETGAYSESYSNGLHIDHSFTVSTAARRYSAWGRPAGGAVSRADIAGIVFHTSESRLAPFDPEYNFELKSNAAALLTYVRRHQLYHFLIDRFGRVYRVVREEDYANHAGYSVWADTHFVYMNLNQAFLGVAFEAGSRQRTATPAQIHAGRLLSDMLRSRYRIPESNCVTHAQVSVNPENMRVGYHTDWASHFPFAELGLGAGYERRVPAVSLFGFAWDDVLVGALDGKVWPGLIASEEELLHTAAARGMTAATYRKSLQKEFLEKLAAARASAAPEGKTHDQT